jgi:hypothetical protein
MRYMSRRGSLWYSTCAADGVARLSSDRYTIPPACSYVPWWLSSAAIVW